MHLPDAVSFALRHFETLSLYHSASQRTLPKYFNSPLTLYGARIPLTGAMSSTDVLTVVNAAAAALRPFRVPLIADGDTGFGDVYNLKRTVKGFARAGAAGIMLEDQVSTGAYQICKLVSQR